MHSCRAKFGTVEELKESLNGEDPIEWGQARVAEMTASAKDDRADGSLHGRERRHEKVELLFHFFFYFHYDLLFLAVESNQHMSPFFMPVRMMSSAITFHIHLNGSLSGVRQNSTS